MRRIEVKALNNKYIDNIIDYFVNSDQAFLQSMGIDYSKIPKPEIWKKRLESELIKSNKEKQFYYLVWFLNDKAIGHSNINNIKFGNNAFMHLHIWNKENRQLGKGELLVKESIKTFFNEFNLQELFCQPKSTNRAPNRILEKLGFELIKKYKTIPGEINFEQDVNLYRVTKIEADKWI